MNTTKSGSLADFKKGRLHFHDKEFNFILTEKVSPAIGASGLTSGMKRGVDGLSYSGGVFITTPSERTFPANEIINCPKTHTRRVIRYVPGEKTIYEDEMSPRVHALNSKGERIVKDIHIKFIKGKKAISGTDSYLVEYMFASNRNIDNPNKVKEYARTTYKLVDREAMFENIMDNGTIQEDAQIWCKKAPFDEVYPYAVVLLGLDAVKSVGFSETRFKMLQIAMRNPVKFMADKDSDTTKRKSVVLEALNSNVIITNAKQGSVAWASNPNNRITTAPIGQDLLDYFINFTMTPEGQTVYIEIMKQLIPKPMKPIELLKPDKGLNVNNNSGEEKEVDTANAEKREFIDDLLAAAVIYKKDSIWLRHKDEVQKWKGVDGLVKALDKPELFIALRKDLSAARVV